ncbi:Mhp366/Mhp367 family surface (lipo)protein [Mesomycoplasma hyopneumoniae]
MKKMVKYFLVLSSISPFLVLSCTYKIESSKTKKKILPEIKSEETPEKSEDKLDPTKESKVSPVEENTQKNDVVNSQNKTEKTEKTERTENNQTTDSNFWSESTSDLSDQTSFDFAKVNQNSIKININGLTQASESDFSKNEVKNIAKTPTYYKYQLKNWENVIKKENETTFLGQKNDNLNIFLIKQMNNNLVDNVNAKANYYSYFNPANKLGDYYSLPYFGFKSDSLEEKRYANIFTRNIRFAPGTAVFLNANSGKAAFLTNRHVLYPYHNGGPFWKVMNTKITGNSLNASLQKFLQYYDDFKIKELDNRILFHLWETKWLKDNGKELFPVECRECKIKELTDYMQNLYNNFFEVPNFDNQGLDVAVFYFNYSKFISETESLIKYFQTNHQDLIKTIHTLANGKFEKFISNFNEFKKYWEKISKLKPTKISEQSWDDEDFDYTTKIGMFWANNLISKNVFKGVNFRRNPQTPKQISANFFASNGPGASGSGIFNADGTLAFINGSILTINGNVRSLFYDQFGLTSHMSSGIALKTNRYNLVDQINKVYLKKE